MNKAYVLSLGLFLGMILASASPTGAYWSDRYGGHARLNHCDELASPSWSKPGLGFVHSSEKAAYVEGIFVLSSDHRNDANLSTIHVADGLGWRVFDGNLEPLQSRFFNAPSLEELTKTDTIPSQTGQNVFVNVMTFDKVPWLMNDGLERTMQFQRVPIAPAVDERKADRWPGLPAVGDFAGDEGLEFVFPGIDEWMAFSHDGKQIARQVIVDKYDLAFNGAHVHNEDGTDYAYFTTGNMNFVNNPDDTSIKRVYKLALEPSVGGVPLPYSFRQVWKTELSGHNLMAAMTFTDINRDGRDELVVEGRQLRSPEGRAFAVLSLDGHVLYQPSLDTSGRISIGDANGDGKQEIIVLGSAEFPSGGDDLPMNESWVFGYQFDAGRFGEIYRFRADPLHAGYYVIACDVDGDGLDEILVVTGRQSLHYWNYNAYTKFGEGVARLFRFDGSILWEYQSPHGLIMSPVIDDLDLDGDYDIAFGTEWAQFLVFDPDVSPSQRDYEEPLKSLHAHDLLTDEELVYLLESTKADGQNDSHKSTKKGEEGVPSTGPIGALLLTGLLLLIYRRRASNP